MSGCDPLSSKLKIISTKMSGLSPLYFPTKTAERQVLIPPPHFSFLPVFRQVNLLTAGRQVSFFIFHFSLFISKIGHYSSYWKRQISYGAKESIYDKVEHIYDKVETIYHKKFPFMTT
ncbi:MAG: hypothetical protein PHG67_12780 [Bacteroidales bacterium]|nr:hypothetical protein [Bacteroidales bacterium]